MHWCGWSKGAYWRTPRSSAPRNVGSKATRLTTRKGLRRPFLISPCFRNQAARFSVIVIYSAICHTQCVGLSPRLSKNGRGPQAALKFQACMAWARSFTTALSKRQMTRCMPHLYCAGRRLSAIAGLSGAQAFWKTANSSSWRWAERQKNPDHVRFWNARTPSLDLGQGPKSARQQPDPACPLAIYPDRVRTRRGIDPSDPVSILPFSCWKACSVWAQARCGSSSRRVSKGGAAQE